MLFDDSYKTIQKQAQGLYKDKGSKFLAFAYPITKEGDVKDLVETLKSEHGKANHFCWAFRLTQDRSVFRLNDDGEPGGTAGRPILNCLLSLDLTNILVVVVRYFGGTLLGVTGLIQAYKGATLEALKNADQITKTINDIYEINFSHLEMNEVMKIIKDSHLIIKTQGFEDSWKLKLEIRKSILNNALEKFSKLSDIKIQYIDTTN
jgi:uncharacterized YigZ family protein